MKFEFDGLWVDKHILGYGITDGKKWFFYAYKNLGRAGVELSKLLSMSTKIMKQNIFYSAPLKLVE